jgi:hypothetical protein
MMPDHWSLPESASQAVHLLLPVESDEAEPLSMLQCCPQALLQHLLAGVVREQQVIEACVCGW